MEKHFFVSTDKTKLNVALIYNYLANESYWAIGRTKETVQKSIENSFCFGLYNENDEQIGFARIVTDYAVFAWVMDVFILEGYRKLGLGKLLMDSILTNSQLQGLKRWGLATDDAHGLYEKYGFKPLDKPETFMAKVLN